MCGITGFLAPPGPGPGAEATLAAIDGPAYGAGALLACSCDIRVASDRARFRFPGSEYGLVVGAHALDLGGRSHRVATL